MSATYDLGLRTGSWGASPAMLSFHSLVRVELAPDDAPDVLVRIHDGVPVVPRDLAAGDLRELDVCTPGGRPVLSLRPTRGGVERDPGAGSVDGVWELRIEGAPGDSLHLYARSGTPFPDDATLERLVARVGSPA